MSATRCFLARGSKCVILSRYKLMTLTKQPIKQGRRPSMVSIVYVIPLLNLIHYNFTI